MELLYKDEFYSSISSVSTLGQILQNIVYIYAYTYVYAYAYICLCLYVTASKLVSNMSFDEFSVDLFYHGLLNLYLY